MTMNTQDILDTFAGVQQALTEMNRVLTDTVSKMRTVIEAAVHDLKDRDEQIRVQQERITSLEEDNRRLQERLAQTSNELYEEKRLHRATRDDAVMNKASYENQLASAIAEAKALTTERDSLKAEGVRLREIILTVATSVDAVVNPPRPTSAGGDSGGSGGSGDPKPVEEVRPVPQSWEPPKMASADDYSRF